MKWERNEGKEEGKNQIMNELIFNLQPHLISHLKCRTSTCRTILFQFECLLGTGCAGTADSSADCQHAADY